MFYSPSRDPVKHTAYKCYYIKAIRDKLISYAITEYELEMLEKRLTNLRKDHEILYADTHVELKNLLADTYDRINELTLLKYKQEKEQAVHENEVEDLKEVKKDLQLKMEQIKEQVNNEMEVIEELQLKSGYNDTILKQLAEELEKCCNEGLVQKYLEGEIDIAGKEVVEKGQKCEYELSTVERHNVYLRRKIESELQRITYCYKKIISNYFLVEHIDQQVQNCKTKEQFYKQRMDITTIEYERNKYTKFLQGQEMGTYGCLEGMIEEVLIMTTRVEKEQIQCEKDIKGVYERLVVEEEKREKLEGSVRQTEASITMMKNTNQNLRMKMNDVFKVDGAVIRTLTNRKMYEEAVHVSNYVDKKVENSLSKSKVYVKVGKGKYNSQPSYGKVVKGLLTETKQAYFTRLL